MRAESSKAPKLANAPNIQGFPTIVGIFQNGKEFPYNGPRNVESFVKFADLIAIGGLPAASENGGSAVGNAAGSLYNNAANAAGVGLDMPKPRMLPKRVVAKVETVEKDDEILVPSFQETLDVDLKEETDEMESDEKTDLLNEQVSELEVQELVKKTLENIDKLKESQETTNYSYFGDDGDDDKKEVMEKQVESKKDTPSSKKTKQKKDLKL
jgi:hypothetical protein